MRSPAVNAIEHFCDAFCQTSSDPTNALVGLKASKSLRPCSKHLWKVLTQNSGGVCRTTFEPLIFSWLYSNALTSSLKQLVSPYVRSLWPCRALSLLIHYPDREFVAASAEYALWIWIGCVGNTLLYYFNALNTDAEQVWEMWARQIVQPTDIHSPDGKMEIYCLSPSASPTI